MPGGVRRRMLLVAQRAPDPKQQRCPVHAIPNRLAALATFLAAAALVGTAVTLSSPTHHKG
jgi:hypothetical protein